MKKSTLVAAIAATAGLACVASADTTAISIAFNAGGQEFTRDVMLSEFTATESGFEYNGGGWDLFDAVEGLLLGRVDSLSMLYGQQNGRAGGPQTVTLDFQFSGGFLNTSFALNANPVVFAPLANATGTASAALTIQDTFNDGVTLTPDGTFGAAYSALYDGGNVFSDLFTSAQTSSGAFSEDTGGFQPVAPSVSDISARWAFTVTAFDSVTGTSVFTVVPTPASAALLGLGGLVALRRRR